MLFKVNNYISDQIEYLSDVGFQKVKKIRDMGGSADIVDPSIEFLFGMIHPYVTLCYYLNIQVSQDVLDKIEYFYDFIIERDGLVYKGSGCDGSNLKIGWLRWIVKASRTEASN